MSSDNVSLEARVAQLEAQLKATTDELVVLRSALAHLSSRLDTNEHSSAKGTPASAKRPGYGTLPRSSTTKSPSIASPAMFSPPSAKEHKENGDASASAESKPVSKTDDDIKSTPPPKRTSTSRPVTAGDKSATQTIKRYGTLPRKSLTPSKSKDDELPKILQAKSKEDSKLEEDVDPSRRGFYNLFQKRIYYLTPEQYAKSADKKEEKAEQPSTELKLDFVYGFNGKSARDNLFFTKDHSEIIYSLAGTGVVYNPATGKQRFMTHHTEDILCLAVHPTRDIVATGQLDPKGIATPFILIWDAADCQVLRKITYHDRGIICVAFSPDGKYLLSIGQDDQHTVALWDWENAGVKGLGSGPGPRTKKEKDAGLSVPLLESMVSKDEVFAAMFNPKPTGAAGAGDDAADAKDDSAGPVDLEFITLGTKHIKVFTVSNPEHKDKKQRKIASRVPSVFAKTKTVQKAYYAVSFADNGEAVVTTQSGHLYRIKGVDFLRQVVAHGESVVGAITRTDDGFATGGDDGKVKFWDADLKESVEVDLSAYDAKPRSLAFADGRLLVGCKNNSLLEVNKESKQVRILMEGHHAEVWALAVHPTDPVVVTGAHDKLLRFWNYAEHKPLSEKSPKVNDKVRSAVFTPDGKHLAVGLQSGKMLLYAYPSLEQLWEKKIALETIDALAVSPDSSILAAGSWDQMIYIIAIPAGKVLHSCKGHTSSVLMVNFSTDGKALMSNSRDYEALFWDVVKGKRISKASEIADLSFSAWNCFLGWPVQGIWEDTGDGTDINAVDRSHDQSVLATGDDYGRVRLYKYPVTVKDAPARINHGHSSHVTSVRFSPDDKFLFSTGGADTGLFQWRHEPLPAPQDS